MSSFTSSDASKSSAVAYNFMLSLKRMKDVDTSKVDAAVALISELYGIGLDDPGDFENYNYYPSTIEDIFTNGVDKLGAKSYSDALTSAKEDTEIKDNTES